jgi:dTDP-4-amino-4,6-dideoxygalactose transaminase
MIPHSRPALGMEEKKACLKVLDSLHIAQGKRVEEFESRFCGFVERKYGVAASSGTSALILALTALDVGPGDEVILPSYACAALLHAVHAVGAKAVPADIDLQDFNISPSAVKAGIRKQTKAILISHSFGRASCMKEILNF